jgi:hypothetical protein
MKKWMNALAQGLFFALLFLCGLWRQKEGDSPPDF